MPSEVAPQCVWSLCSFLPSGNAHACSTPSLAPAASPAFRLTAAAPHAGAGVWSVARVSPETGEIAGVFETIQPSDTDLGSKEPKEVKISGIWYGQYSD